MYFRQVLHEERSCLSYLVGCPGRGVAAVVDPQGSSRDYLDRLEAAGLELEAVVETHVHADHRSAARELAGRAGVPLYLGPGAGVGFEHRTLAEGDVLRIGNRRLRVMHTPGHTPEHVCLVVDDWFVLTGDTLFVGDVGRVDLELEPEGLPQEALEARARQLRRSLERLLELPDWTEVYPGHYAGSSCGRAMDGKPASTIGRERRTNRALRLEPEAFVRLQREDRPQPPQFRAIKRRNLGLGP